MARCGTTHGGSDKTEPVELPAQEFLRRWCLHILPKGFTKTRCFGGWSNHHCKRYVAECRELLHTDSVGSSDSGTADERVVSDEAEDVRAHPCPTCGGDLELIEREHRVSWRDVFGFDSRFRPAWYRSRESSG